MTTISRADPTAEAVKNMLSPDWSGIAYVMKRYIVEDLASGMPTPLPSPSRIQKVTTQSTPSGFWTSPPPAALVVRYRRIPM